MVPNCVFARLYEGENELQKSTVGILRLEQYNHIVDHSPFERVPNSLNFLH